MPVILSLENLQKIYELSQMELVIFHEESKTCILVRYKRLFSLLLFRMSRTVCTAEGFTKGVISEVQSSLITEHEVEKVLTNQNNPNICHLIKLITGIIKTFEETSIFVKFL